MAHGEATVKDPDSGQWIVKVWQRGTVQGTAGGTVTVKSADGSSWTWHTGSDTMVFKDGARSSGTAGIADGETVFLAGTRAADGSNTAERILIGTPKDSQRPGNRDDRGNRAPHRHHHGPWRGGPSSGGGASDSGSSSSGSSSGSLSPGSFS